MKTRKDGSLYLAYGRNLNPRVMRQRCPDAVKVGAFELRDARLVFRDVADVTPERGSVLPVGLWWITRKCEVSLDDCEGPRYHKLRWPEMKVKKFRGPVLMYQMRTHHGVRPPSAEYFRDVLEGYRCFGLDPEPLHDALRRSYEDKRVTAELHDRFVRGGRKPRAQWRKDTSWCSSLSCTCREESR